MFIRQVNCSAIKGPIDRYFRTFKKMLDTIRCYLFNNSTVDMFGRCVDRVSLCQRKREVPSVSWLAWRPLEICALVTTCN